MPAAASSPTRNVCLWHKSACVKPLPAAEADRGVLYKQRGCNPFHQTQVPSDALQTTSYKHRNRPPFTTCVYCTCIHVLDQAQLVYVSKACHESTGEVRAGIREPQDRGRHYTASHKLQKRAPFTTCVHCIYMHLLNKAQLVCSSMACHRTTGSAPSAIGGGPTHDSNFPDCPYSKFSRSFVSVRVAN